MEKVEEKVQELVMPLLAETALRLEKIEYVCEEGEWFLRVFINKAGGIEIDDCVSVSKPLSKLLDEADFIKEQYYLEVSSPGTAEDAGGKIE